MRQDQFERLITLEEQLTDVFIGEAEPTTWSGTGLLPKEMDQQTRGDRYWCKRNAVATLSLVQRVASLVGAVRDRGAGTTPAAPTEEGEEAHDDLEAAVVDAEREAARLMRQLGKAARGGRPAR
jgi:hypothetical protein